MTLPGGLENKVPSDKQNDSEYMASVGLVATNNNTGCMFLQIDSYILDWVQANKGSTYPLADLGCAYGIHTLHALKQGRDVIAVDMDQKHISALRKQVSTDPDVKGRLLDTHVAKLPCKNILGNESISAALLSEVLHFLKPGEPLQLFQDIFNWLIPSGLLVLSTASAKGLDNMIQHGAKSKRGTSEYEVMRKVKNASGAELFQNAFSFTTFSENSQIPYLYFLTTEELTALARVVGFEILKLEYYSPRKYQVLYSESEEAALMIARKPKR